MLILCCPLLARAESSYILEEKETVSELLYNRLNIKPIYRGFLKEVLEFNQLSEQSARKLRPGKVIRLPQTIEEKVIHTESHEKIVSPISHLSYYRISGTFSRLEGKSDSESETSFNTNLIRPELALGHMVHTNKAVFLAEASVGYQTLQNDENRKSSSSLWLGEIFLRGLWKSSDKLRFGLDGKVSQSIYVIPIEGDTYKVSSPWLGTLGPRLEFGETKILGITASWRPDQDVSGGVMSRGAMNFSADFSIPVYTNKRLLFSGSYYDQETSLYPAPLIEIKSGMVFPF